MLKRCEIKTFNKSPMLQHNKNLEYCKDALALCQELEGGFLELGKYLYNIRENALYEPQWASFGEFCMEMRNLSPASISKLINVYKRFELDYKIPQKQITDAGGWTLVADLLPVVSSRKEAMEWLDEAAVLTRSDLHKRILEKKSGVDMSKCLHKDQYTITVCRDCGERFREYDENKL